MTHVIRAKNVNDALVEGLWWLHTSGEKGDSRNGSVVRSPTPVVTEYERPRERVLFSPLRDANPFFHLMESLWMLAGRNDVAFPAHFAANIANFSDDGVTVAGAYGHRWRNRFAYDQLPIIIDELRKNPESRRCVLSMWDPDGRNFESDSDLYLAMNGGKDVPCNTQAYFDTLGGKLNMTVTNRSNDVIWGCYGANMVHFSMLHEYMSIMTGLELGTYRQFSNNYHMYTDRPDVQRLFHPDGAPCIDNDDMYGSWIENGEKIEPFQLMQGEKEWHSDLNAFFGLWLPGHVFPQALFIDPFWSTVAVPVVNCHSAYKRGDFAEAFDHIAQCAAPDWRIACQQWIDRRKEKRNV